MLGKKILMVGGMIAGLLISDFISADTYYYPVTRREARHIRHYERTHPCTKVIYRKVCTGRGEYRKCFMQKQVVRVC